MKDERDNFHISFSNLKLYAAYVVKSIDRNNRASLVLLKELLDRINPYTTYGESERRTINTFNFLKGLINARLEKIKDREILIQYAMKGIDEYSIMNLEDLDRELTVNEMNFIEGNISSDFENYNNILAMSNLSECWTLYHTSTSNSEKERIMNTVKDSLRKLSDASRKATNIVNTELFSLEDDVYTQTIEDVYERNCNPSNKLQTGMCGFNQSLAGGYESGRVYVYLGLPGEGKSTTLLNIGLQIKQHNKNYQTKDPSKRPCILFLTMENSLQETVERIFSIMVSNGQMRDYGSYEDILYSLKRNGLAITEDSPIDFVIKFVPANTVSTDYLYTIYDELLDQGKECICVIQDYIKRIKCRDFKILKGDMRLGLGAVIDEFKEFANEKQIPIITASQMNREATSKVDEGRKTSKSDLVRNLGRNNIGESLLILENADAAYIITPEITKFGKKYLGVSLIKSRFDGATLKTFFHPYNSERTIELEQDISLAEPLYKLTLAEMTESNKNDHRSQSVQELARTDDQELAEARKKAKIDAILAKQAEKSRQEADNKQDYTDDQENTPLPAGINQSPLGESIIGTSPLRNINNDLDITTEDSSNTKSNIKNGIIFESDEEEPGRYTYIIDGSKRYRSIFTPDSQL